jgi:IclR family transcriptional regulator, KDG regulon repressor
MRTNRSVERAISVLMYLCQDGRQMGLTEISQGANLDKATTLRILNTLANADMVRQEVDTKHYVPGAGIYNFWPSEIRKICRPHLKTLLENTQETICLVIPRGKERVCIEVMEPDRELRIVAPIGRSVPIHLGATGRVFMATKLESRVQSLLNDEDLNWYTEKKVIDNDEYLRQLEKVKLAGYAYSIGEVELDTSAVSVPIYDALGNTAAAIAVRGPVSRLTEASAKSIAVTAKATAKAISSELISTLK